ncbi:divergent polysaccharide deacetylase family protein [Thiohalorhabdus sp. Cl-TMA]|uniref:Divergent polysaccharide deacetylase family protein n=1 Tax=Thiohalorhabdus methylotrophus TaxID=3242694 RepID=A0ABV4TR27_9GAMM
MAKKGAAKRKKPTPAQRRRRYLAAGFLGIGLLVGLVAGTVVWLLGPGSGGAPAERTVRKSPRMETDPPPPRQESRKREDGKPEEGLMERGPRAAIIIDDLGNSWPQGKAVSRLPFPVAVAVLPGTPYADRTARRAHARGKEVLVHMPMEPEDGSIPLGPTFLRQGMDRPTLLRTMRANLQGIPYAVGINNHMGSALTADSRPMGWVMEALGRSGLFFIDSRTTADTHALEQAHAAGVPSAGRDIFLDHRPTEEFVRRQFQRLMEEARAQGTAIAIGHPHPATLKVLRELLPATSAMGVEIVPVREVVAVRARQEPNDGTLAARRARQTQGERP